MSQIPMKNKHPFWLLPSFLEPDAFLEPRHTEHSGLSVAEDKDHVIIEAALPGLSPEDIEITFEKGTLWIKGERKEEQEDKKRNYYRKASRSFSYHVDVPGDLDMNQDPTAEYANGMMIVRFKKSEKHAARSIKVNVRS